MTIVNIVIRETQHNIADLAYSKTQTLQETLNSKSNSSGVLCIFGSRTVVPVSWMCREQTSVSHSSTGSEIISLGAGLRVDGLPALDISENVIEVLRTTKDNIQPGHTSSGKLGQIQPNHTISRTLEYVQQKLDSLWTQHVNRKQGVDQLSEVDHVLTNTRSSQGESQLYIFWGQRSRDQDDN